MMHLPHFSGDRHLIACGLSGSPRSGAGLNYKHFVGQGLSILFLVKYTQEMPGAYDSSMNNQSVNSCVTAAGVFAPLILSR